ncbi:MAG TPA: TetR/AcrR family transcriptional regulator [Pseudonocardia sp.]
MPRPAKRAVQPRLGADSSARRDEIRAAAGRVFAEHGFVHTTMRDVGEASGTGAGSLYHHFTSKDEILLELLQDFYTNILRDLNAAIRDDRTPLENLQAMIELALWYVVEHRDESRILLNDYPYIVNSPVFKPVAASARTSTQIWLRVLREALDAGQLRPGLDVNVAFSVVISSIFSSLRFFNPRGKLARSSYIEQVTTQLVEGLRRHGDEHHLSTGHRSSSPPSTGSVTPVM